MVKLTDGFEHPARDMHAPGAPGTRAPGTRAPGTRAPGTRAPGAGIAGATEVKDRLAGASGLDMGQVVLILLVVDAVVVIALCAALAPLALPVVLPLFVIMPFAAGGLVNLCFWAPWARRYPARPQSPDAVVKKNQSFMLGRGMWLNNALHIAADERHLHLIPIVLLRWGGAKVISLPWDRMENVTPMGAGALSERRLRAEIDGRAIAGPEWCMRLVMVEAPTPDPDHTFSDPEASPSEPRA